MQAAGILTSIAILMLAAAMWDDLSRNERVTPARKTYLIVACIFALVNAVLHFIVPASS